VGRSFQHAKIHGPQRIVNSGREYGIAIVHHESVYFVADEEASELLCCPVARRVFCDIPMQDATRADSCTRNT
jgi:hypothetical protein